MCEDSGQPECHHLVTEVSEAWYWEPTFERREMRESIERMERKERELAFEKRQMRELRER